MEIFILAGGLSTRMGRDKARLRLGGRTLLAHVRSQAGQLGWPVRVVRRDVVPRCGPLGGVVTALRRTRAATVLFLSCDMPFVPATLMARVLAKLGPKAKATFVHEDGLAGFPFALRRECLTLVEAQVSGKQFSLQRLAAVLDARRVRVTRQEVTALFNVNTPEEWAEARRRWSALQRRSP